MVRTQIKQKNSSYPVSQRVEHLLEQMSLSEKMAQLGSVFSYDLLDETGFSKEKSLRLADGIGQVTRLGTYTLLTPSQRAETANAIQDFLVNQTRLGIPAIFHDECCSGYAALGATSFPQMIGLASTFRPDLAEAMGIEIRKQMRACGSHQGLAPVLDILRDPRWGRSEETFGEDPTLVARFSSAYVQGLQGSSLKDGVIATGKHFLAHSASEGGLNCTPVHIGQRELRETYLPPYEAAVREAGLAAIMNSYSELDGQVVAANKTILRDLLRNELGFSGMVVSDYLAIEMLHSFHRVASDLTEAAVKGLQAGIDLELPETLCYGDPLLKAVAGGQIDVSLIDEAVRRILTQKFELGLFDRPMVAVEKVEAVYRDSKPQKLAREIAAQSLVLLKNEGGLLPLPDTIGKLAVIGPNAATSRHYLGDYSHPAMIDVLLEGRPDLQPLLERSGSQPSYKQSIEVIPTVFDAILSHVGSKTQVFYAKGCNNNGEDRTGFAAAVTAAQKADCVLLVLGDVSGLTPGCTSGEFNDRASLELPGVQEDLVKTILAAVPGKPVVAVLINGRPLAINWLSDHIPAILEAWMPGEQGALAIADALFGNTNPGGKLPVSLPRSVGQLPIFYNHKPSGGHSNFRGDYADLSAKPLYPFGHGLSYTQFAYRDLEITPELLPGQVVRIACKVRNMGDRSGDEVVQFYIQDDYACVPRPVKELKGFYRITLAPEQEARIEFELSAEHLAYYDEMMKLTLEPGTIHVMVGSSSADIRLEGTFRVTENIRVEQRSTQIVAVVDDHI